MRYNVYFDTDNYKKFCADGRNIKSDLICDTDDNETANAVFEKYCRRAASKALEDKDCTRFNVHIIDGWQTTYTKNFYSRRWMREVGRLENE